MLKKNKLYKNAKILVLVIFSLIALVGQAETLEDKGLKIFEEANIRDSGFVDSKSNLTMILIDNQGNTSHRGIRVKSMEGLDGDGDKTLMIFDTPKDQKGTALLTFSHVNEDNDQWLYLPALKRVKKIASRNKSGPFVGSEFSFEDIGGSEVAEFEYKYLREEMFESQKCFVVASFPKDKYSGYTSKITWIDQKHYRSLKTEFYDRKKSHLKTLKARDFRIYNNKFWRPDVLEMVNIQSGKRTELRSEGVVFSSGLTKSAFNKNALKRSR